MSGEMIPKGYKRTEVGVIPEEWKVTPLKKLISTVEYGSSAKSMQDGRIPVLRMGNLQDGKIDWRDLVFTSDEKEIAKYLLNPEDVLFNRTNTVDLVGKTSLYDVSRPAIFAGYLIRINTLKLLLNNRYLNYVLNTQFSKQYSQQVLSVAVSQANINGQKLKTYPIPIPPTLAEQQAIAAALSDADAWIESLESLIAKKRQIKQGAMQELLTGKRRLPGFSGKWEYASLGREISLISGYHVLAQYCNAEMIGFPYVTGPSDFASGSIQISKFTTRPVTICEPDDILITVKGSGVGSMISADGQYCISRQLMAIRISQNWSSSFMYYCLLQESTSFGSVATGLIPGISRSDLLETTIFIPEELPEQSAIASVLSDMDAELEALEGKLAKARQVKQGMMQQLLTGKIRLV